MRNPSDCKTPTMRTVLTTREAASYFGCVCLSVCQTMTFERRKFIFAHLVYLQRIPVKFVYESHRVKVKVTGAEEQKGRKSLFPQCKTSIGHNVGSLKHKAMRFACGVEFSDMADRMV